MKTVVITGGTDGIGKALALTYLKRGDRVVAIGTNPTKGRTLHDAAATLGATDRLEFIRADLSLVAENQRVLDRITGTYPVVDVLVLGARYYRSQRAVTAEGFEANFALFYLSRYLLGHGLVAHMERAATPVLVDLSGPGGDLSHIRWADLQFGRSYDPDAIMHQCGKLSDLLAVAFTHRYPHSRIRYLLLHPGLTATGFTGDYSPADAAVVAGMRNRAQPVETALARILPHLDNPPSAPLSAFMQDTPVDIGGAAFDPAAAERLARHTEKLLSSTGLSQGHRHGYRDAPGPR
ncbi:SDR family NAD(P)-dependent oxidoreductase [Nocardia brevicatena]|uniref:SDR family NAD(P)-dependent oxidoreductase n=1 Tax=Nocardia brevicatena TaxID=37327 RepID=UPI000686F506|nr:SDR family NAD(P)-dependent oxidoreductase [Nocardia brevicatena]